MQASKKTVIVAPLDWGLGHATRCIPIIRALELAGHRVILVTGGRPLKLLKKEFSNAVFYDVPSYNIVYQKRGSFLIKLTIQLRKILGGILRENRSLRTIIARETPDLIISDNRYGIRSKKVYSVFISHQMMIKIPGSSFLEKVVEKWLRFQHAKFDEIWMPDTAGNPNLSGDLSHKPPLLKNSRFIGLLNRFELKETTSEIKNDVLCILSGPEPQRSIFEQKIVEQAVHLQRKFIIVQGISEQKSDVWVNDHVRMISHAHARKLMDLISDSRVIISRGGYTTLMDLVPLNKRCIFVPTPGQTEQQYLVKTLADHDLCVHMEQKEFDLKSALEQVEKIKSFHLDISINTFQKDLESALINSERKVQGR